MGNDSFVMVIFGGAGDLARKKLLPSLYHLYQEDLIKDFSILALGRTKRTNEDYRQLIHEAVEKKIQSDNEWEGFKDKLNYHHFDVESKEDYKKLCGLISELSEQNKTTNVIYYLAVQPSLTPQLIDGLYKVKLCREKEDAKIVMEKPFGHDLVSAKALNETVQFAFNENQVYRIDHYLGKETVQNILFFRFANSIFEPLWNRNYIDHIQITAAEDIGVEGRGRFYEESGVIKDIIQNHIMQLISMVAMEPPVGFEGDLFRNEKISVFRAMRSMTNEYIDKNIVVGQYDGYRKEKNVNPKSTTPTFFAGKFHVDNWRLANVPIYVRAGKRLKSRATYIVIEFKKPPLKIIGSKCDYLNANRLLISIQPSEAISLRFSVKHPGSKNRSYPVTMDFDYNEAFHVKSYPAYERLLLNCMKGDQALFERQDGIEATWSIVDPIIERTQATHQKTIPLYESGAWGPKEAEELMTRDDRNWLNLESLDEL